MKKLFTICTLLLCQLAAIAQTYKINLLRDPDNACIISSNPALEAEAGKTVKVLVNVFNGYIFDGFLSADTIMGPIKSEYNNDYIGNYSVQFTMPAHDVTITAKLHYSPTLPSDPGEGMWNEATGALYVTMVEPGRFSSVIGDALTDMNGKTIYNKVKSLTISGKVNDADMNTIATSRTFRDSIALLDMSRTNGVTLLPINFFSNKPELKTVLLPASIDTIGYHAFWDSPTLESVTCFATMPPRLYQGRITDGWYTIGYEQAVFNQPNLTVYVPAESLPLYAESKDWKDFELMPITQGIHSLTVNLPATEGNERGLFLELANTRTGQTRRYVLTNRTQYTFTNLIEGTQYNLYIKNAREDILGTIEAIDITNKDTQVTVPTLKPLRDVTLRLTAPGGSAARTDAFTVTWTDPIGNYLAKGTTLPAQVEGSKAIAKVKLAEALGTQYQQPADTLITVDNTGIVAITLAPLPQQPLTGTVTAEATGLPIRGATVSVTQLLNGLYPVTQTANTDAQGHYTLTAYNAPTEITAQAPGYVREMRNILPTTEGTEEAFALRDITGTTVQLDFNYLPAVPAGQPLVSDDTYSDFSNITYTIHDLTNGKELTDFTVQTPLIVLDEQLPQGTKLQVTVSSRNGTFADIKGECIVDAQNAAQINLPLLQLGQLKATFAQTDNNAVVAMLYDANGQLKGRYYYDEAKLTITAIPDGQYTLVTMGESQLFNGINTLEALTEMRLEEGRDYVSNTVAIQAGRIDSLHNQRIPMLDETVFYYTGENTRFSVNKTTVTVGNYVTLRAQVDFKQGVNPNDVRLVFDLPDGCSLVEGSVMVGNQLAQYEVDGRRVTVPLLPPTAGTEGGWGAVRFCVVPTHDGYFEPTASISFSDGDTVMQPLGSVGITVESLNISVPEQVSGQTVYANGTALGGAQVQVYDNGVLIGQTEAGPNGYWSAKCQLVKPYNLSEHPLYAVITTTDGLTLQTESKTVTVSHGTLTPVVSMSYATPWGAYTVKWDFRDNTVTPRQYTLGVGHIGMNMVDATFKIDFMDDNKAVNDTLTIKEVVLYVLTDDNSYVRLPATYNKRSNSWYTNDHVFDIAAMPNNVALEYYQDNEVVMDRMELDDILEDMEQTIAENQQMVKDVYAAANEEIVLENQALYDELKRLSATENPDEATLNRINELLDLLSDDDIPVRTPTLTFEEIEKGLAELNAAKLQLHDNMLDMLSLVVSTDTITKKNEREEEQYDIPLSNGVIHFTSKKESSVNEQALLNEGYTKTPMTDGSSIYYLDSGVKEAYLDSRSLMHYILEWEEGAQARPAIRQQDRFRIETLVVDSIFNQAEREHFHDIFHQLSEISYNSSPQSNHALAQVYLNQGRTLSRELYISANNLYSDGLKTIRRMVWELRDETIARYKAEIAKARALKEEAENNKRNTPIWNFYIRANFEQQKSKADDCIKYYEKKMKDVYNEESIINGFLYRNMPNSLGNSTLENTEMDYTVTDKAFLTQDTPIGLLYALRLCYHYARSTYDDLGEWQETYQAIRNKIPCEGNENEAIALLTETVDAIALNGRTETKEEFHHAAKFGYADGWTDQGYQPNGPLSLSWFYTSWKDHNKDQYKNYTGMFIDSYRNIDKEKKQFVQSKNQRNDLNARIKRLKCKKPDPDNSEKDKNKVLAPPGNGFWNGANNSGASNGKIHTGPNSNMESKGMIDPSGFVYEAVESNRLEGVTATCFYKETVEDMYGDLHENVVLWDAERYAQENPLFTDAEGQYAWDVPTGLWQVKFEKAGYETAYSDWLPVPPPQLDVNVGMTQLRQPTVSRVKACTDGIDITFDKYMDPQTLTTENIFVTRDGQTVPGTITLLNAESAPGGFAAGSSPDSSPAGTYASQLRFNANFSTNDKLQLTIKKTVESYAGLQMEQDFTQQFDVEQRITAIEVDSIVNLSEGGEYTITVRILPAEAAKGKTITATALTNDVVAITPNGNGAFALTALSLGQSAVRFSLTDDADITATTLVTVRDAALMYVYAPKSSRLSGTEVYRGAEIRLTCATAGATILYTLDGSCPCDAQNAAVQTYTGPITATGTELTIRAMAVANGMAESDVAEFRYKVVDNPVAIEAPTASSGFAAGVPVSYYRLDGSRTSKPQKGLNIVRQADGTVHKYIKK